MIGGWRGHKELRCFWWTELLMGIRYGFWP